jgi:L-serine/L-threonine ammonia-lyase
VSSWVTTDAAAVRACGTFLDDHRVMVEPACGAGLAAVYEKVGILADRHPDDTILVEVCGGALMDSATLATMRAHFDVVDNY